MKNKISTIIKKVIKGTAIISRESTSVLSLYQLKTPKILLKTDKKKVQ